MEYSQKSYLGTPMNPVPQNLMNKRLPPKILPFNHRVTLSRPKIPLHSNTKEVTVQPEKTENETINSPKLPIISIKKNKINMSNQKFFAFAKVVPKYHIFKPLFHGRNKSYNFVQEEDEELRGRLAQDRHPVRLRG